jgi:hypothetical protein
LLKQSPTVRVHVPAMLFPSNRLEKLEGVCVAGALQAAAPAGTTVGW